MLRPDEVVNHSDSRSSRPSSNAVRTPASRDVHPPFDQGIRRKLSRLPVPCAIRLGASTSRIANSVNLGAFGVLGVEWSRPFVLDVRRPAKCPQHRVAVADWQVRRTEPRLSAGLMGLDQLADGLDVDGLHGRADPAD